jgi:hypothetical protein
MIPRRQKRYRRRVHVLPWMRKIRVATGVVAATKVASPSAG